MAETTFIAIQINRLAGVINAIRAAFSATAAAKLKTPVDIIILKIAVPQSSHSYPGLAASAPTPFYAASIAEEITTVSNELIGLCAKARPMTVLPVSSYITPEFVIVEIPGI